MALWILRRFVMFLIGAAVSFSLPVLTGCSDKPQFGSEKTQQSQSKFLLPQKHEVDTGFTREEQKGRRVYEYYCALCHGKTGQGNGFNSSILATPPAKHADSDRMVRISDTQIKRTIKDGGVSQGRSPLMPAWGGVLLDKEISYVTAYIRTLTNNQ